MLPVKRGCVESPGRNNCNNKEEEFCVKNMWSCKRGTSKSKTCGT